LKVFFGTVVEDQIFGQAHIKERIMLNPNADPIFRNVVRIRQRELLQEIEAGRPYRQPGLLQRINHQVKTAGQWVKSHTWSTAAEPCFDGS